MPQHESAKKSVRQDKRRTIVNRKRKGMLKSNIKKVLLAIEEKNTEKARQAYSISTSLIDKMAAKGLIHKNNAARKKSSLSRKIASLS
ncbi:MAG: 30S ribosomal protein S20 [bacterium]